MKLPPFTYAAPETLEEAVALKASDGDEALVLAGGQSLIPLLALRLASPTTLVDLDRVGELVYVEKDGGWLRVGAMTRQGTVEDAEELLLLLPLVADALPLIGHRAIRNRGTVGGSVAHADPAAEWPALALALDATVESVGPGGPREIAALDFFRAPFLNALEPDEIVREVRLRVPGVREGSAFVEHAMRYGDFALAGVAAVIALGDDDRVTRARLVLLGVGGTPLRATEAEQALEGRHLTEDLIGDVAETCRRGIDPPSTVQGSGEYRRHLAGVLVGRALRRAAERARAA